MAFQKIIYTNDNTGVYAEYWKVSEITANWVTKTTGITLLGYLSHEARLNSKNPIMIKTFTTATERFDEFFSCANMQPEGIDIVKKAYQYIQYAVYSSEFADAIDV
jgi:hypothetical protein